MAKELTTESVAAGIEINGLTKRRLKRAMKSGVDIERLVKLFAERSDAYLSAAEELSGIEAHPFPEEVEEDVRSFVERAEMFDEFAGNIKELIDANNQVSEEKPRPVKATSEGENQ